MNLLNRIFCLFCLCVSFANADEYCVVNGQYTLNNEVTITDPGSGNDKTIQAGTRVSFLGASSYERYGTRRGSMVIQASSWIGIPNYGSNGTISSCSAVQSFISGSVKSLFFDNIFNVVYVPFTECQYYKTNF